MLFGKLPSQAQSNESLTKPDAVHGLSKCKVAVAKVRYESGNGTNITKTNAFNESMS